MPTTYGPSRNPGWDPTPYVQPRKDNTGEWKIPGKAYVPGLSPDFLDGEYGNVTGPAFEYFLTPYSYDSVIMAQNATTKGLLDELGGPPGRKGAQDIVAGLQRSAGRRTPDFMGDRGDVSLMSTLQGLGASSERALQLKEPERQNELLNMLVQQYGIGGHTVSQYLSTQAQRQKIYETYFRNRKNIERNAINGIPLVGSIVAGFV